LVISALVLFRISYLAFSISSQLGNYIFGVPRLRSKQALQSCLQCHPEPFTPCHSERSEESHRSGQAPRPKDLAQGKLREGEESHTTQGELRVAILVASEAKQSSQFFIQVTPIFVHTIN